MGGFILQEALCQWPQDLANQIGETGNKIFIGEYKNTFEEWGYERDLMKFGSRVPTMKF